MNDARQSASPIKVCLMGGSFNSDNLGVTVLTVGSIKTILNSFPDAQIYLFDYGQREATVYLICGERTVPIEILNARFSKNIFSKNHIARLLSVSFLLKLSPSARITK